MYTCLFVKRANLQGAVAAVGTTMEVLVTAAAGVDMEAAATEAVVEAMAAEVVDGAAAVAPGAMAAEAKALGVKAASGIKVHSSVFFN